VIAKSDLIILVLSSSALAFGVYRWHQETQDVSAVTIPASSRTISSTAPAATHMTSDNAGTVLPTVSDTDSASSIGSQNNSSTVLVQTLPEPEDTPEIVVSTDVSSPTLGSYTVQSGDYLGKIAGQVGTDIQTLRDLNGISGDIIEIGQEILYPL